MKKKYTIADCVQFCTLIILFFDIPYVLRTIPYAQYGLYMGELAALLFIVIGLIQKKDYPYNPCMIWFVIFAIFLIFNTIIHNGEILSSISIMLKVLSVSFVFYCSSMKNRKTIINRYIVFFTSVVCIDLLTEFLFPNGMFVSRYTENWFLGYKTYHLLYSFPLCVFLNIKMLQRKRFSLKYFLILFVSVFDMYRSNGTSGTVILLLYEILSVFVLFCHYKKKKLPIIFHVFYNFVIALAISIASFVVVVINNSQTFLRLITSVFSSKSMTLSGRVQIWAGALKLIKNNLIIGMGKPQSALLEQYMNGFNNAHNVILTYLLYGGIVGLLMFFIFHYRGYSRMRKTTENLFLSIAIYAILGLGITSAVLSFSSFYFAFLIMISDNRYNIELAMINERKTKRKRKK